MYVLEGVAYIDGSYNQKSNRIGCAAIIFIKENYKPHLIMYSKQLKSQKEYGSNIAELSAAKTTIKTARSLGLSQICIHYDWNGIEIFSHVENVKKRHSACPSFATYANYVEEARKDIKITFIKVKAHSSDKLNNQADIMARKGKIS